MGFAFKILPFNFTSPRYTGYTVVYNLLTLYGSQVYGFYFFNCIRGAFYTFPSIWGSFTKVLWVRLYILHLWIIANFSAAFPSIWAVLTLCWQLLIVFHIFPSIGTFNKLVNYGFSSPVWLRSECEPAVLVAKLLVIAPPFCSDTGSAISECELVFGWWSGLVGCTLLLLGLVHLVGLAALKVVTGWFGLDQYWHFLGCMLLILHRHAVPVSVWAGALKCLVALGTAGGSSCVQLQWVWICGFKCVQLQWVWICGFKCLVGHAGSW